MLKISQHIFKTKCVFHTSLRGIASTTTIDPNEVSHFKKYSSTWWDETGEMKPLHSMNVLRVPLVRDSLINSGAVKKEFVDSSEPLTGLQILDVGCGGGILSEPLTRLGGTVVGIDAVSDLIEVAKGHAALDKSLKNLTYIASSVEEVSQKNPEVFDAVIASEILEHVNDPTRFVSECVKCLKPGGSILITTVNKTFLAALGVIYLSEYIFKFLPIGTHQSEKFIEPHTVQRLLEDNNCCTKLIHGMYYNYFTNNWSWISDTSISYALHAVKVPH